ncbi:hypothetical protein TNCV_5142001 [Trichonephila clavipes]|nr:hypothetical protein TNCV_5142001 [Trichonephila clavipes]
MTPPWAHPIENGFQKLTLCTAYRDDAPQRLRFQRWGRESFAKPTPNKYVHGPLAVSKVVEPRKCSKFERGRLE